MSRASRDMGTAHTRGAGVLGNGGQEHVRDIYRRGGGGPLIGRQIDVFEALVHPPRRDAAGEDVQHHHREALSVGGVGRGLRQMLVKHGEDA